MFYYYYFCYNNYYYQYYYNFNDQYYHYYYYYKIIPIKKKSPCETLEAEPLFLLQPADELLLYLKTNKRMLINRNCLFEPEIKKKTLRI